MSDYLSHLRNQQSKHKKRLPKNTGTPAIRHTPKAHNATIPAVDWRFETSLQRGYGINEDGTVEVLK